jgi:hypothetical protein
MSTAKPNVLMIAYHFPPVGGAGVQRTVKFARYLPAFGFKPIVLAGSGPARDRWTPEDQGMLREIPGEVRVRRIPGTAPAPRGGWRGRMGRWIGRPSPFSRWWIEEGTRAGAEIIRNEDIELVYASMSPFESAEVAHRLASECDCPWVADLRDPWALDEMQVYPSFIHWLAEKRRMRRALASASLIVMNTPEAAVQLERAFPELRHKAVAVITNGYDAVEFPDGVAAPGNERFTIVHSAGSWAARRGARIFWPGPISSCCRPWSSGCGSTRRWPTSWTWSSSAPRRRETARWPRVRPRRSA